MNPEHVTTLQKCKDAEWFGKADGRWVGEIKNNGKVEPLVVEQKVMEELARMGWIKPSGKVTRGGPGMGPVNDYEITPEGKENLPKAEIEEVADSASDAS